MATEKELIEQIKEMRIKKGFGEIFNFFNREYGAVGSIGAFSFIINFLNKEEFDKIIYFSKGNYDITIAPHTSESHKLLIGFVAKQSKIDFIKSQMII